MDVFGRATRVSRLRKRTVGSVVVVRVAVVVSAHHAVVDNILRALKKMSKN